jgi:hypothetical protein
MRVEALLRNVFVFSTQIGISREVAEVNKLHRRRGERERREGSEEGSEFRKEWGRMG